jgi:membrane protein DedA with SNARE-associated domain
MFLYLEKILIAWAEHMHLAIFAPVVSFIEEIISPIPSPSVMIATGIMAKVQGYLFFSLIIFALLGAIGKTLGASVAYFVADKVEDLLSGKIAKFLGITHEQIENFGEKLSKSWKDYLLLTFLRALPIVPSSILSVGCGILKVKYKVFFISTLIGSVIRDFIYIYVGYVGTKVFISFTENTANGIESTIEIILALALVLVIAYFYLRRRKTIKLEGEATK